MFVVLLTVNNYDFFDHLVNESLRISRFSILMNEKLCLVISVSYLAICHSVKVIKTGHDKHKLIHKDKADCIRRGF